MKIKQAHKAQSYTLIEIMVAMAILVIMMGFLFQFVISGHKMWTASESTSNVFDQAQIALELIENDLQSVFYTNDEEDPGHSIPMGIQLSGSELESMFLVVPETTNATDAGVCMVMYILDNDKLLRYVFDSNVASYSPLCFYGFDPITMSGQAAAFKIILDQLKNNADNVVLTGIKEIELKYMPSSPSLTKNIAGVDFFTSVPKAFKITLNLYDAAAVKRLLDSGVVEDEHDDENIITKKKKETGRVFNKIVFLRK